MESAPETLDSNYIGLCNEGYRARPLQGGADLDVFVISHLEGCNAAENERHVEPNKEPPESKRSSQGGLTDELRGRAEAPDQSRGRTLTSRARGA